MLWRTEQRKELFGNISFLPSLTMNNCPLMGCCPEMAAHHLHFIYSSIHIIKQRYRIRCIIFGWVSLPTEDDVSVIFHAVYILLHTFVRMAERRVGGYGVRSGRDSHIVMLSWYGKFPSTLDAIEYRKWQTNKKWSDEIKLFKSILSYCIS